MGDRVFTSTGWGGLNPASGWQLGAGTLTGGTRADLFAYHPSNGSLWVGTNTGTGFTFQHRATVSPASGWRFHVGDFTGSGLDDVVGHHPGNGSIWVGENLGTSFQLRQWGAVQPATGWHFGVGAFTGGPKADLFAYHEGNGTLWVGRNTGPGFEFQQWGTVATTGVWQFVVADITGTGRSDVVGYDPSDGSIWVGENSGSSFHLQRRRFVLPAAGWQLGAGYFTGRAKSDLFAYHPINGSLWVATDDGTTLQFEQWASTSPAAGWQFVAGVFDADLWVDLVGYLPSTGELRLWRSSVRPIEGYCWPLSAAPGEHVSFMTSGGGAATATIRRHTSTSTAVDSVTVHQEDFDSPTQPLAPTPWSTGCGWDETFGVVVPDTWRPGIYSASCADASGDTADITFVVKPSAAERSEVALLANVNTWLAYNGWGGHSKYSGLARASFMRPNPGAAPQTDYHLTRGELWIHGWLESAGYRPDVYTDLDFHENGCDASQYRLLVVGTHPEYWTVEMYDNLLAYLDAGGSLAYLGGNGLFESGDYDAQQRAVVFRMGVEGGPRVDALFRVRQPLRPERAVLGVATERCSVLGSPYAVVDAGHDLFDGTGVVNGSTFGHTGLNTGFGNGKASAWEIDTANGIGAISIPWNCAMDEPATVPGSGLPDGLTILATGVHDGLGPGGDITYYDHPGGGFVFSVGSLTFGGSLVVDGVIQQLMHNVLARAGVTPV
ncbi:MAG TPA: VCBS repeat-containing protein [Jiangellales bacterium]|nr:VCBS repeat-containing protein [Jiangellales bacterium]